ncbi:MAG: acyl carrier protein [Myxococcota bacterium]
MKINDIDNQIKEIAEEVLELDPEELVGDLHLADDLNVSSVIRLEFLVALERKFGVRFDSRIEGVQRISELVPMVETLLQAPKS